MLLKKYPEIQLLGHYHDRNVLLVPKELSDSVLFDMNAFLDEIGHKIGLTHPQMLELKNTLCAEQIVRPTIAHYPNQPNSKCGLCSRRVFTSTARQRLSLQSVVEQNDRICESKPCDAEQKQLPTKTSYSPMQCITPREGKSPTYN